MAHQWMPSHWYNKTRRSNETRTWHCPKCDGWFNVREGPPDPDEKVWVESLRKWVSCEEGQVALVMSQ